MNTPIPTPRTDANAGCLIDSEEVVPAGFARKLEREVARLTKQIKDDNRSYGCELRDPNGTIWEQATKDHARAERAEAELAAERARHTALRRAVLDVLCDPEGKACFHGTDADRAAIDAAMKEDAT